MVPGVAFRPIYTPLLMFELWSTEVYKLNLVQLIGKMNVFIYSDSFLTFTIIKEE
jgi:hypothetical protein